MIEPEQTAAYETYELIASQDRLFYAKAGAHNFVGVKDGFNFDVIGPKFAGRVVLEIESDDRYKVTFGRIIKYKWVEDKTFISVAPARLAALLKKEIGLEE